jgi:hypothetical protein
LASSRERVPTPFPPHKLTELVRWIRQKDRYRETDFGKRVGR